MWLFKIQHSAAPGALQDNIFCRL